MEKKSCQNCGNYESKDGCGNCNCCSDRPVAPTNWTPATKPRICEVLGVEQAMEIVTEELRGNKSPGSWYYSWQSNLACTIMDNADIDHDTANKIAVRFLDRLCASKPCFTQEEAVAAQMFFHAYPQGRIERGGPICLIFQATPTGEWNEIPPKLFPSLRPGQSVNLEEITDAE